MTDILTRLKNWNAVLGEPTRRSDPDQEIEWLILDAQQEVEKLRVEAQCGKEYMDNIRDAVARLKADNERLRKALAPFVDAADYFSNGLHRPVAEDALPCGPALIVKHLRDAKRAVDGEAP